jgi:hypothetical protein
MIAMMIPAGLATARKIRDLQPHVSRATPGVEGEPKLQAAQERLTAGSYVTTRRHAISVTLAGVGRGALMRLSISNLDSAGLKSELKSLRA